MKADTPGVEFLRAVHAGTACVGFCDPANGEVYLRPSGTGLDGVDLGRVLNAMRFPPACVWFGGEQFAPISWLIAAGLNDSGRLPKLAAYIRARAGVKAQAQ